MTFDNLQKRNRWIKGGTLKALSLSALFLFSFLFLINLTSAWNFASSDDYSLINWTRYTTYQTVTNYTETDPVWTADKSSYTLLSVLNNGSYLNPEGTDTFIGNYSTFLTHITYDDVMNGTLKDYFDGLYIGIGTETESKWNANYSTFLLNNISITNALNTKLGISQWNATNTSYALLTELNNGSYLNVDTNIGNWTADKSDYYTSSQVNDVNTSMQNYVNTQNTSVTNALNTKLGISQWNATNTSYYLASNPSGFYSSISNLGNWTADKVNYYTKTEVNSINTSMKNYVDWVNTTNPAGEGSYDDSG